MQNRDFHIKDILNYLGSKMSERERYAFERRMEADPFLMDAVEGYQTMSPSEIERELLMLRARIKQKNKVRIVPMWMKAAAAILILLGIGTLWLIDQREKKQDLVSDRLEVRDKKAQKHEQPVLSTEKKMSEMIDVAENNDETLELKEQTNVQHIVAVPPAEQPTKNKSIAQVRSSSQALSIKIEEPLHDMDSMLFMEEESAELSVTTELSSVEMDKVDKPKGMMIRGASLLRSDTLLVFFKGKVVDENGIPLPGVSITNSFSGGSKSLALADNSAITDMDGKFKIKAPKSGAVLQLSFIGFKDKIAVAKNDSIGVLVMEPDQMALGEVAVLGYGTREKKNKVRDAKGKEVETNRVEGKDTTLFPEPEGGIIKLVKRVERRLRYPNLPQGEKINVAVEVFVSSKGEVIKVQTVPSLEDAFLGQLRDNLKAAQWTAPTINGMSIASSRKIVFEFAGER